MFVMVNFMHFSIYKKLIIIILCGIFITSCSPVISYKRPQIIAEFGSFECKTSQLAKRNFTQVWDEMRAGFCLDNTYSERINREINWFVKNKSFVYRSINRAKPFLYYVVKELERNNLPLELALLPIVESGYQPFAYSPSKAAGIWQFIPATAREYGLNKNWWYDGRRDVLNSTRAASHFLKDMHRHFKGDWLLAIASYNTGAGKVGRSIKKARSTIGGIDYWDLDLPRETELYVPKLLALREIILNPTAYNFKLPKISNKPYYSFVKIKYPIDFYTISILSNTSEKEIQNLNAGFSAWYFIPSLQNYLLLPSDKVAIFKKRYKDITKHLFDRKTHLIVRGDSLSRISKNYNVSIKAIKVLNGLKSNMIIAGKTLKLPIDEARKDIKNVKINNKSYFITPKQFTYNHTVKRYDNWYKIAKFYNVNLNQLLKWNNATKKTTLRVASKIKIIMKTPLLSSSETVKLRYVVNSGDTTAALSTGFNISRSKLLKENNITKAKYLTAGKNLIINLK